MEVEDQEIIRILSGQFIIPIVVPVGLLGPGRKVDVLDLVRRFRVEEVSYTHASLVVLLLLCCTVREVGVAQTVVDDIDVAFTIDLDITRIPVRATGSCQMSDSVK